MPRPSTTPGGRLGRNLPGVAASWSGPLPTGGAPYGGMGAPPGSAGGLRPGSSMGAPWAGAAGAGAGMQPELNGVARSGTPPRTPGTPQRLRSRGAGPLRASAPAPLSALADVLAAAHGQGSAGPGAEVWVNPGSLPGVSAEQRERALLRSSMGNRAVADATGSASSAAAAASAFSRMLHAQQGVPHGALPSQAQAEAARSAAAAAGGEGAGRRGGKGGAVAPPIKLPRRGTGPNQSALEHFAPTRGMVYSVFKVRAVKFALRLRACSTCLCRRTAERQIEFSQVHRKVVLGVGVHTCMSCAERMCVHATIDRSWTRLTLAS